MKHKSLVVWSSQRIYDLFLIFLIFSLNWSNSEWSNLRTKLYNKSNLIENNGKIPKNVPQCKPYIFTHDRGRHNNNLQYFSHLDNCFSVWNHFPGVDQLAAPKKKRKNNYLADIIARGVLVGGLYNLYRIFKLFFCTVIFK